MTLILAALAGALLFRGRGGAFNRLACAIAGRDSSTVSLVSDWAARALYALGLAALAGVGVGATVVLAIVLLAGTPLGWFGALEARTLADLKLLALRGLIFAAPAVVVLAWLGLPGQAGIFLLAGPLCGPLYYAAARIPSRIPQLRQGPELGEALFGAVLGAALALGAGA